jgi:hypothetical protein
VLFTRTHTGNNRFPVFYSVLKKSSDNATVTGLFKNKKRSIVDPDKFKDRKEQELWSEIELGVSTEIYSVELYLNKLSHG